MEPQQTSEEYVDSEESDVRVGWRPQSLDAADWCLKRLGELNAEIAENQSIVAGHVSKLKLRLDALNSTAVRGVAFFESRLREFAEANKEELLKGGKKKSRALPHGTLGWKKTSGGLEVKELESYLEWARNQPMELEVLRIKEEPAMAGLQKLFKETGELPPGCEMKEEKDEVVVKPVEAFNGKH